MKTFNKVDTINKAYKYIKIITLLGFAVLVVMYGYLAYLKIYQLNRQIEILQNTSSVYGKYSEVQMEMAEIQSLFEEYGVYNNEDYDAAAKNALRAFADSLGDKYATYLSSDDYVDKQNEDNELGIGMGVKTVNDGDNGFYVIDTYVGSGAYNAGIRSGDYIISINDIDLRDLADNEYNNLPDFKLGDEVEVTYNSNSNEYTTKLYITEYNSSSVLSKEFNDIAYIRIDSFTTKTSNEFISVMNSFKNKGFETYIIDLRHNYGGVAVTTVEAIDYLVPKGIILESKGKAEEFHMVYESDSNEFNGNIVVLIDDNTASAAELFAQSLKEYDKAIIIGETSFGKGTVVYTQELQSTDNKDALILSVAKYYTKSGECLEGIGVIPDIEVIQPDENAVEIYKLSDKDMQFQAAVDYLNSIQ